MKKKRYKYPNGNHSATSIFSAILGSISVLSVIYAVICSYMMDGEIPGRFGVAAVLTVIYALIGLSLGLFALRDRDTFHGYGVLGLVLNSVVLLIIAFVLGMPA